MKAHGFRVELIQEYVKSAVYEDRKFFDDQVYIFAKQNRKQHVMRNEVDWLITDSPLILNGVYAHKNYFPSFAKMCIEAYHSYDNLNFLIKREKEYVELGRMQTEQEAKEIDNKVISLMLDNDIKFKTIPGTNAAPTRILNILQALERKREEEQEEKL